MGFCIRPLWGKPEMLYHSTPRTVGNLPPAGLWDVVFHISVVPENACHVCPLYRPVSSCALCTGLDSGEPFSRSQIESTAKAPTAKNSLCQFWKDSNQKREVPTYWSMETGGWPCSFCSSL
jgi:hypothetical protein